jgi:hypothetical protein
VRVGRLLRADRGMLQNREQRHISELSLTLGFRGKQFGRFIYFSHPSGLCRWDLALRINVAAIEP